LKLITSNFDVHEMVKAHSGLPIVKLYINLFSESILDIGEENSDDGNGDDKMGYSRIKRDDPYWDDVDEPDLFVENNDVPRSSRGGEEGEENDGGEGREDSDGCGEGEESVGGEESEKDGGEEEGGIGGRTID
jgi:hypothetical protein